MNGIIAINKPNNMTSRDVVNIVGKYFHTKKIGHTGTLDPMATGVLVLCMGKSTKLVEILMHHDKEYIFECCLGIETDTLDITGNILKEEDVHLAKEEIEGALKSFQKTYFQEVPIYSAIKVKGKKLYQYARKGEEVSLPKKEITVYAIELLGNPWYKENKTFFKAKVKVSSGTYIRSLIRDIALSLHTIGIMTSLKRISQGEVDLLDTCSLEELEKGNFHLLDEGMFYKQYPTVEVEEELSLKIQNGALMTYQGQDICLFTYRQVPLALYKRYEKDPSKMKPWKML